MSRISTQGLDNISLILALWNKANKRWHNRGAFMEFCRKFNFTQKDAGIMTEPQFRSTEGLSRTFGMGTDFLDDVLGVLMLERADFARGSTSFDPTGYNRRYGPGLAERVVTSLRAPGPTEKSK